MDSSLRVRTRSHWLCAALAVVFALGLPSRVAAMECVIESLSDLAFGRYLVTGRRPVDAVAFLVFSCTDIQGNDMVSIEIGRSLTGGFAPRVMTGPGSNLEYDLYLNAGRTRVWGDGTAGTFASRVRPFRNRPTSVPIYGRIPPSQGVQPGIYSDTVVVSLVF